MGGAVISTFIQLLASGLSLGAIYALVALGFVVIFRSSQVFNFAHGELVTLGAFLIATLAQAGVPFLAALALGALGTGLVAAGVERVVLRPMVGRPVFVTIILTLFVGFVLRALLLIAFGTLPMGMATPWDPTAQVEIGGAAIFLTSLYTMLAGALSLGAFFIILKKTRLGVAMRATAQDQEAALALGIPVGRVFGISWFMAGIFAAIAGAFLGMFPRSIEINLTFVALRAFPAVIVGGLDSALGTVIAGLALGVLEVMTQGYVSQHLGAFGQNVHTILPYLVMIVFLVIRPHGIFGRAEVRRI